MQTPNWLAHMGAVRSWSWSDNHVSLIFNALRYILIRKIHETAETQVQEWPQYNDGRIQIDRNQFWGDYPVAYGWDNATWPGGNNADNYPEMTRLTDSHPAVDTPVLDLRGLGQVEARFILLMLGSWERRTRMRLDCSLTKLADAVMYRSDVVVGGLARWITEPATPVVVPAPPIASFAWVALIKYILFNRLFDHFSVALQLISALAYQMLPVMAKGQIWLSFDWMVNLPQFNSVRGRYTFLNEEDLAFVSHRALSEWSYIGNKLQKINLMANVFVQAAQTGMAVRSVRIGMEDQPQDLYNTFAEFYTPVNMMSAAASEAIRSPVPLTGMSGVYVTISENFDTYNSTRTIPIVNTVVVANSGYEIRTAATGALHLAIPYDTFAGIPTLILPINPFPHNTMLSLKGVLKADMGVIDRRGFRSSNPYNTWLIASVYRIAGYDLMIKTSGETAGRSNYYAPNDVHFVWPPVINSYFRKQIIEYEIRVMRRGWARAHNTDMDDISEFDGILSAFSQITMFQHRLARLRGYISHDEQGFRFVENVTAGVIPQPPQEAPAPEVG